MYTLDRFDTFRGLCRFLAGRASVLCRDTVDHCQA